MNWNLTNKKNDNFFGLDLFKQDLSKVFDDFFSLKPTNLFQSEWMPNIDVEEDENTIHVKAEMPGIDEKDISVNLENNILTLKGEKNEEKEEKSKDKKYHYSERKFGSFSRSITLPENIKTDTIEATFKKGILKIEIPKDETKKSNKIQVEIK
ncbi:MAG: Hsp20/alpha crystallin family protein [Spirochaetota bacterium]|nr:Hsp20/alpha crystallin family protein [Spirochaetota bacterium]